ncbi:MAG TPA: hypothetical protein VJR89_13575, partial [Polyangiales bacterium]|nr:hypothetical protein [Polyangiales bacterium]
MKPTRLDAPQLKHTAAAKAQTAVPDDPSESGVRYLGDPAQLGVPSTQPASVTVVFRGVFPMERLVQVIRRRATETAPGAPMRVEVEPLADSQRWRVSVHLPEGEYAASEPGPFLAVTR